MLLSEEVEVKWNAKNKKHYVDLGYTYTKIGDSFTAKVEDLTKGNHSNNEYHLMLHKYWHVLLYCWYSSTSNRHLG